jgi:hypothetical protein
MTTGMRENKVKTGVLYSRFPGIKTVFVKGKITQKQKYNMTILYLNLERYTNILKYK